MIDWSRSSFFLKRSPNWAASPAVIDFLTFAILVKDATSRKAAVTPPAPTSIPMSDNKAESGSSTIVYIEKAALAVSPAIAATRASVVAPATRAPASPTNGMTKSIPPIIERMRSRFRCSSISSCYLPISLTWAMALTACSSMKTGTDSTWATSM